MFSRFTFLPLGLTPFLLTFSAVVHAQTYTAGAGLKLTGSQFSIANGGVTGAMIGLPLALSASSSSPILTVTNTGSGYGIKTVSTSGTGTYGTNTKYGNVGTLGDINGFGVYGSTAAGPYPYGVYGINRASGNGDYGILGGVDPVNKAPVGVFGSDGSTSGGNGVFGNSTKGSGVAGISSSGFGVLGVSTSDDGMQGQTSSDGNAGVSGVNNGSGDGVFGVSRSSGDYGFLGGIAQDYNNDYYPAGVYGYDDSSGGGEGVKGHSLSGAGVEGDSDSGEAVIGLTKTGLAGHFYGDVYVTGTLMAGTKDFKIDHPLDPAGKYLYHASVESDKMEDIYNGHVILGAGGAATVTLPEWFGALNTDFEYHLTPIGAPGPNLYIAQEITDNKFQIAGGKPGMKVSWQVTGVRHDAFALAHPLQVEQDKPEKEKGLYQNPDAFGQPDSMGINHNQRHPAGKQ